MSKALRTQQFGRALRDDPVVAFGVELRRPRAVVLDYDERRAASIANDIYGPPPAAPKTTVIYPLAPLLTGPSISSKVLQPT